MYDQHQPLIAQAAQSDHGKFADVGLLCILSARMPFERVRSDFATVKAGDFAPLFAWKTQAWGEMQRDRQRRATLNALMGRRTHAIECQYAALARDIEAEMLATVCTWYGFNLVKGGFFLQLCYGLAGCLDIRNERDYGISAADTRAVPAAATRRARERRAKAYLKLCRDLGGTETLWDAWCNYYAASGDGPWSDGWQVSAEHCRILGINPGEKPDEIPF